MAVTAAQLQNLILLEIGAVITEPVGQQMAVIWELYTDKSYIGPKLQYLYTKRHAVDIMLGQLRELVTFESDREKFKNNEQILTLARIRSNTQEEIDRLEQQYAATRDPYVTDITTKEPINQDSNSATVGYPNAANRRYRGDAYPVINEE